MMGTMLALALALSLGTLGTLMPLPTLMVHDPP